MAANPTGVKDWTADLERLSGQFLNWLETTFFTVDREIELAVLALSAVVIFLVARALRPLSARLSEIKWMPKRIGQRDIGLVTLAGLSSLILFTASFAASPLMVAQFLIPTAGNLALAWFVILLITLALPSPGVRRVVAPAAWSLAALNIVGLLDPLVTILESATLPIGENPISVLDILRGGFTFILLTWGALTLSRILEGRLQGSSFLPASLAVLMGKTLRIFLLVFAFLIGLDTAGIDLTVLAVFGGALGVGLGFGLQKVVSNFVSGLILLLDQSIKPGDVVEVAGTYGRINKLAARYTSVITRDGTEYLIPNENMITESVVNWSHSNKLVRRRIPLQISYESDLKRAMALMNEAAAEESRVLSHPAPKTLLRSFGESGIDLELRLWIQDPQDGVANIASAVMMRIWDKFHANGIDFPYPHRVVRIENTEGPKQL